MTDVELDAFFAKIGIEANDMLDKVMVVRQTMTNGRKQKLSYITKKLDLITKCCNLAQDRLRS